MGESKQPNYLDVLVKLDSSAAADQVAGPSIGQEEDEVDDESLFAQLEKEETHYNEVSKLSKILIIGAGGIGCELLKDLVLEGYKNLEIVDLDTIDVSNLNRQFLFQRCHVSKPKAIVARESALTFNPDANIVAHHDNIFNSTFGVGYFKEFKMVVNALDNRAARNHVNRMCLAANIPLIDSGTAGYHGQVEMVFKGQTQCYECEPKLPQKTYPGCTIRNTPSEPVHCIVWAKHLFNQLFGEEDADNEVSPDSADPELFKDGGQRKKTQEVRASMDTGDADDIKSAKSPEKNSSTSPGDTPSDTASAVHSTSAQASVDAEKPVESSEPTEDNDGAPPGGDEACDNTEKPEQTSPVDFSSTAGNVARVSTREWARSNKYSPKLLFRKFFVDDIKYLLTMEALWTERRPPQPSKIDFTSLTGDHVKSLMGLDRTMQVWDERMCAEVFANACQTLEARLEKLDAGDYLVWDKDDDVALDFVTACANIRSAIFGIPIKSRFDVKAIAGNIIPAIATTNAIIGGIAITRIRNVLMGATARNTTVHLRKYPNPNDELFIPEKQLIPPNPRCYVCAPRPQVTIELDVTRMIIQTFEQLVLKECLNVIAPDVSLPAKSQLIISSEEGETEQNNQKTLSQVGVEDGCILEVDDFMQEYQLKVIVRHKPYEHNAAPFTLIGKEELAAPPVPVVQKSDAVEPDSTGEPVVQKRRLDEAVAGPSGVTTTQAADDSDDDCIMVGDVELMEQEGPAAPVSSTMDECEMKRTAAGKRPRTEADKSAAGSMDAGDIASVSPKRLKADDDVMCVD